MVIQFIWMPELSHNNKHEKKNTFISKRNCCKYHHETISRILLVHNLKIALSFCCSTVDAFPCYFKMLYLKMWSILSQWNISHLINTLCANSFSFITIQSFAHILYLCEAVDFSSNSIFYSVHFLFLASFVRRLHKIFK